VPPLYSSGGSRLYQRCIPVTFITSAFTGFSFLVVLVNLPWSGSCCTGIDRLLYGCPRRRGCGRSFALCLGYGSAQSSGNGMRTNPTIVCDATSNLSVEDPESELKWKYVQGYLGLRKRPIPQIRTF